MKKQNWFFRIAYKNIKTHAVKNILITISVAILMALLYGILDTVFVLSAASDYGSNFLYVYDIARSLTPFLLIILSIFFCGFFLIYDSFALSIALDAKQYGLVLVIGGAPKEVSKIFKYQVMLITASGIFFGLVISILFALFIQPFYLNVFFQQTGAPDFHWSLKAFFMSSAAIYFVIYLTAEIICSQLLKLRPLEALNYELSSVNLRLDVSSHSLKRFALKISNRISAGTKSWSIWRRFGRTTTFYRSEEESQKRFLKQKQALKETRAEYRKPNIKRVSVLGMARTNAFGALKNNMQVFLSLVLSIIAFFLVTNTLGQIDPETLVSGRIGEHDFVFTNLTFSYYYDEPGGLGGPPEIPLSPKVAFSKEFVNKVQAQAGITSFQKKEMYYALIKQTYALGDVYVRSFVVSVPKLLELSAPIEGLMTSDVFAPMFMNTKDSRYFTCMASEERPIEYREMMQYAHLPVYYIDEEVFEAYCNTPIVYQMTIDVSDEYLEAAEQNFQSYTMENMRRIGFESRKQMISFYQDIKTVFYVLGYILAGVMAIIGILGLLNMALIGKAVRKGEFAILSSLGMTNKQRRQMLTLENSIYFGLVFIVSGLILKFYLW